MVVAVVQVAPHSPEVGARPLPADACGPVLNVTNSGNPAYLRTYVAEVVLCNPQSALLRVYRRQVALTRQVSGRVPPRCLRAYANHTLMLVLVLSVDRFSHAIVGSSKSCARKRSGTTRRRRTRTPIGSKARSAVCSASRQNSRDWTLNTSTSTRKRYGATLFREALQGIRCCGRTS